MPIFSVIVLFILKYLYVIETAKMFHRLVNDDCLTGFSMVILESVHRLIHIKSVPNLSNHIFTYPFKRAYTSRQGLILWNFLWKNRDTEIIFIPL